MELALTGRLAMRVTLSVRVRTKTGGRDPRILTGDALIYRIPIAHNLPTRDKAVGGGIPLKTHTTTMLTDPTLPHRRRTRALIRPLRGQQPLPTSRKEGKLAFLGIVLC